MKEEDPKERETKRRVEANRDADAETREPVEAYDTPARPGTLETGKPDREQLGEGDRMDLRDKIARTYQPPGVGTGGGVSADFSDEDARRRSRPPGDLETGRQDRKELTGQRAQSGGRTGMTETDTQGSQQTRDRLGMEDEPQRGGRTARDEDVEKPRPDREREGAR